MLAAFAALIMRERPAGRVFPLIAFTVVLFAPTVLVNSSWWGQRDSIYAAFCLGSLYFLLRNKPWWAAIFFGLAMSFKLQAIFFLPVLIIVLVVNRQRALSLLAVPATFALMLLPAALAGRDWGSLLMIYPNQVSTGGTATAGRPRVQGRAVWSATARPVPAGSAEPAAGKRVSALSVSAVSVSALSVSAVSVSAVSVSAIR